jgi:hypothetical protein
MSRSRMVSWLLVAVSVTGAQLIALPRPAGGQSASVVATVTIQGQPVVGSTLTAVPLPNDPTALVEYRWQRCPTTLRVDCVQIGEAGTGRSYVGAAADVGNRVAVRAVASIAGVEFGTWSPLTSVVTGSPAPLPAPAPTLVRPPAPAAPPASVAERTPFLRPFPVVRVRGMLVRGGARISLLRIRAPSAATADVRCDGPRCHLRRRSSGGGRVAALERFLRAGTRITIRVFTPDSVGKYVRLVIRDGAAPARRDACLFPGSRRPAECPPA